MRKTMDAVSGKINLVVDVINLEKADKMIKKNNDYMLKLDLTRKADIPKIHYQRLLYEGF